MCRPMFVLGKKPEGKNKNLENCKNVKNEKLKNWKNGTCWVWPRPSLHNSIIVLHHFVYRSSETAAMFKKSHKNTHVDIISKFRQVN